MQLLSINGSTVTCGRHCKQKCIMCNFIAHRKNNVSFLLERKIVENQLCTSNRNVKLVVLLPIVRKTSHFYVPSYLLCIAAGTFTKQNKFLFLNWFYFVRHGYRLHLSFAHRELVFQKASNSYERHQLFSYFVIKLERKIVGNQRRTSHKMHSFIAHRKNNVSFLLERKIIENQLCTSNRNVKCVVLLPIVRKTYHFYVPSYLLCIAAGTFTKQNNFLFLNCFYLVRHRYRLHLPSLTGNLFSKKHRTVIRGIR